MKNEYLRLFIFKSFFLFKAAMKNVLGQAGQIAGKTKNVESVTGLFKGITGKQDVKNVLSGVAVSLII